MSNLVIPPFRGGAASKPNINPSRMEIPAYHPKASQDPPEARAKPSDSYGSAQPYGSPSRQQPAPTAVRHLTTSQLQSVLRARGVRLPTAMQSTSYYLDQCRVNGITEVPASELAAIRDGGGNGSIIGRNSFQRTREDALDMLGKLVDIYKGKA